MFVLSSPSGAGKTTLSRKLLSRYADGAEYEKMVMSVSLTTRKPRPGEEDGKDYFFIDDADFLNRVSENQMLEHAKVFDHHYGTPREFVENNLKQGVDVLFDIDWQGTKQLTEKAPGEVVSVFILPPSMAELERRLQGRAQDSAEVVARRMSKAEAEISHWGEYDYVLVNEDLDDTLARIDSILRAERLRRVRQQGLEQFVAGLY